MKELVFLLEELSAKVMIEAILPKISKPGTSVRYIVFQGKQDLEKSIFRKLRGYNNPDAIFIVLRDQDAADCKEVKSSLKRKCEQTGKSRIIVRIACRELESWYLADLKAVEKAFCKKSLSSRQNEKKFRNSDNLKNPSKELKMLVPEYQKINGSRMIASYMDPENTRSSSFYHFIRSIEKYLQKEEENHE